MTKIWKAINGYEGIYEVSNQGRVRSLDRLVEYRHLGEPRQKFLKGRLLKGTVGTTGYLAVSLCKDSVSKPVDIHRLVAFAFVKGYSEIRNHVDHVDGNRQNNRAENLRWCSNRENHNFELARNRNSLGQKDSESCRKNLVQVHESKQKPVLCVETKQVYPSATRAAQAIGVTKQSIWYSLKHGGKCKGFHFVWAY